MAWLIRLGARGFTGKSIFGDRNVFLLKAT